MPPHPTPAEPNQTPQAAPTPIEFASKSWAELTAPFDHLYDQTAEDIQLYRSMLQNLMRIGIDLARTIDLQANARLSYDSPGRPDPNAALAYERVSRALRRNIMLAVKIAQNPIPIEPAAPERPAPGHEAPAREAPQAAAPAPGADDEHLEDEHEHERRDPPAGGWPERLDDDRDERLPARLAPGDLDHHIGAIRRDLRAAASFIEASAEAAPHAPPPPGSGDHATEPPNPVRATPLGAPGSPPPAPGAPRINQTARAPPW